MEEPMETNAEAINDKLNKNGKELITSSNHNGYTDRQLAKINGTHLEDSISQNLTKHSSVRGDSPAKSGKPETDDSSQSEHLGSLNDLKGKNNDSIGSLESEEDGENEGENGTAKSEETGSAENFPDTMLDTENNDKNALDQDGMNSFGEIGKEDKDKAEVEQNKCKDGNEECRERCMGKNEESHLEIGKVGNECEKSCTDTAEVGNNSEESAMITSPESTALCNNNEIIQTQTEKKINENCADSVSEVSLTKENDLEDKDQENSKACSGDSKPKSVEKVTDADGSEILITINEEHDESDSETEEESNPVKDNNKSMGVKEMPKGDKASDSIILCDSPEKKAVVAPKPVALVKSELVNSTPAVPVSSSMLPQIRFPVISDHVIGVVPTTSIQNFPSGNQKIINVNGQQILLTMPSTSFSSLPQTTGIVKPVIPPAAVNAPVNVFPGFPPPSSNKDPFDKTLDSDVPQASWEQIELIKYEVASRKPDNAFWGGLANVSKRAELSGVSKFLFDIGSDLVKESAYEQIVQVQQKKDESDKLSFTEKESLQRMKKVVTEIREKVKFLNDLPSYKCDCGYTTSSSNVMYLHKQYPHGVHSMKCVHCQEQFDGKQKEAEYRKHMTEVHSIVPLIPSKPNLYPCSMCLAEGPNKHTLVKHKLKCMKTFKPHLNQAPHHVDINLCMKNIFYKFQVVNKRLQAQKIATNQVDTRANIPKLPAVQPRPAPIQPKSQPRPILPPNVHVMSSQALHNNFTRMAIPVFGRPQVRVSEPRVVQPVQRQPIPHIAKPTVNQLLKTQQSQPTPVAKGGFEVCEICGGYVKDRMSLRIHFFYAHKIEMPAHVFNKAQAPLFCSTCNERFWTSQGFTKHQNGPKHIQNLRKTESTTNQCWICKQKPENLYSHLHKFHRLTTGECMALKRCMFCGILAKDRKDLELHMAATHGVLIKGDENKVPPPIKPPIQSNVSTKNLSTVVTGGSSGMVRNNYCVFCSSQFLDNTKLTLHCLSVHATCKKCGMVVNKQSDLVRHVCKMSSKTCSICGMKNLKPAGLLKHLESHTKPCKIRLKRLSPIQIEKATGGKISRFDPMFLKNQIKSITSTSRGKVVIDLSGETGTKREEVIIDESDDSDVIVQEVEKTEIVLDDSEDEESETKKFTDGEKKETSKSGSGGKFETSEKTNSEMENAKPSMHGQEIARKVEGNEQPSDADLSKDNIGNVGENNVRKEDIGALSESHENSTSVKIEKADEGKDSESIENAMVKSETFDDEQEKEQNVQNINNFSDKIAQENENEQDKCPSLSSSRKRSHDNDSDNEDGIKKVKTENKSGSR